MSSAKGSRKIKSAVDATGQDVLFYAAFAALIRDPVEWSYVAIVILPPAREST
ncbi:MAG: hypothetical protein HQL47_06430 [Gammaproteobacteria bacterium]|nr:hypothetical protein [Gammaproteobacteria bacterium]